MINNATWLILGSFFALSYFHSISKIQKIRRLQERQNKKLSNQNITDAIITGKVD